MFDRIADYAMVVLAILGAATIAVAGLAAAAEKLAPVTKTDRDDKLAALLRKVEYGLLFLARLLGKVVPPNPVNK